ncbi:BIFUNCTIONAL TH2 PROTEIN, partial [Salix purpurea]
MAIPPRLIASSSSSCASTSTNNSSIHIEEGLASKFWIKFMRESVFSMYTPFIISLASGTLKIDSFRHYISQDSHFLKSFAHA